MAFKMGFDKDSLTGKTAPNGIYTVRLSGFRPALSKNKDSVNFNPQLKIINHPEHDNIKVWETLNSKAGFTQWDFAHAFGVELEDQGNGQYTLPVTWDGDPLKFKEDDPSTWVANSVLIGRDAQVELAIDTFEGKQSMKPRRYICAIDNCETRFPENKHSTDLLRNKK